MATRTRSNFKSTKNTRFTTNGTGSITGAITNDMFEDTADSVVMYEDMGVTNAASVIKHVKVTIPTASILTGFTSPVTLIAAQGAGTVIEVLSNYIFYDYNSAAYATNTTMEFGISGGNFSGISGIINQTQDIYYQSPASALAITTANISNQPFLFRIQTGNPTAGNSPVYVYLTYRVITL